MNAEALGMPPGELAAYERVRQLQTMIDEARTVAAGAPAAGSQGSSGSGFAAALQSATDAASAPSSYPQAANAAYGSSAPSGGYESLIDAAAQRNGLDPAVLHGLIQQESAFNPSAQSSAGASGLTQLMPATATSMGVANPLDPAESIEGGARYLSQLMRQFGGNTSDALAAYNAGPGAVSQYGGIPPYAESYRQSHPAAAPLVVAA